MIKSITLKLNVTVNPVRCQRATFQTEYQQNLFLPQSEVRKYNIGLTVTLSEVMVILSEVEGLCPN